MNVTLPLCVSALALSGCVSLSHGNTIYTAPAGYGVSSEGSGLRVTREGQAFDYSEGLEAREAADAFRRGRVRSSTRDNFREGAWIFPEGCA